MAPDDFNPEPVTKSAQAIAGQVRIGQTRKRTHIEKSGDLPGEASARIFAIDDGKVIADIMSDDDRIIDATLEGGYYVAELGGATTGLGPIAATGLWQEKILKEKDSLGKKETFVLEPDEFVLALTYERIWIPRNLIGMVEGRSTYARAGLTMHQTAPWLQPGWNGHITLEIRNSGPLRIDLSPKIERPCQVTFF
jgi:hypothetical protein